MMRLPALPAKRELRCFPVRGPREAFSEIWLAAQEDMGVPIPLGAIQRVLPDREESSIFATVERLVSHEELSCFEGNVQHVLVWLKRIHRILGGMRIPAEQRDALSWRCSVLCSRGEPQRLTSGTRLPRPGRSCYARLMEKSVNHPVYVPAVFLRCLYEDTELASDQRRERIPKRLRKRFLDYDCDLWEPANGLALHVKARVFVPDPFVVDLLGSALLERRSILLRELAGREILEPCTGSGVLAGPASSS